MQSKPENLDTRTAIHDALAIKGQLGVDECTSVVSSSHTSPSLSNQMHLSRSGKKATDEAEVKKELPSEKGNFRKLALNNWMEKAKRYEQLTMTIYGGAIMPFDGEQTLLLSDFIKISTTQRFRD